MLNYKIQSYGIYGYDIYDKTTEQRRSCIWTAAKWKLLEKEGREWKWNKGELNCSILIF